MDRFEGGTYFCSSSLLEKKNSNIFAQRSVTSRMLSMELITTWLRIPDVTRQLFPATVGSG